VQKRVEFENIRHALNVEDLIFIDESGCHPGIGPLRGWSPKGVPLWGPEQSYARGRHVSVVGAISLEGLIAKSTVRGGVGSKQFRRFVERQLVPVLRPGHVVCMDNLNAHKNKKVRDLIEDAGATILFLPPYSPDFNPIEAAWAKMKHLIRKYSATCVGSLRQAIYRACRHLRPEDIRGWFRYCGYRA
jgi:transposase